MISFSCSNKKVAARFIFIIALARFAAYIEVVTFEHCSLNIQCSGYNSFDALMLSEQLTLGKNAI